jgi:isopropylmalate/homocitrate/citramalate synthase
MPPRHGADYLSGIGSTGTATSAFGRVVIFDTTMRDGEQSPGASMTLEEKLQVAELLDEMGVDIIEAGFPIASKATSRPSARSPSRSKRAIVCGLARATPADIDRAAKPCASARPRIHTFISTSPVHMKHKLKMEPERRAGAVGRSVAQARNLVDDVEWSRRGRDPHRARLPLPLRRGRDQGRRDHDQHARHGRLRRARRVRRADPRC